VAADRADLYAYFFERGVKLLRRGGRLGYISSSTFFRTGSGENLRTFLGDHIAVESVIDFGDLQLFEGVTTYPAILTLKLGEAADDLHFLKVKDHLPDDLGRAFMQGAGTMPRTRLGAGSWRFEDDVLARLRDKIAKGRKTLGEVYGPPAAGIKTGLNTAFVIDGKLRERLISEDPQAATIIKKFAMGDATRRWSAEFHDQYILYLARNKNRISDLPSIERHLLVFKNQLEQRALKQKWFELQQAQPAYEAIFNSPKIIFRDISEGGTFSIDHDGMYLDMTCFAIASADFDLLSLLNSRLAWFFWKSMTPELRGGYVRLKRQFVERLPIPLTFSALLSTLAQTCTDAARARFALQSEVRHRILDLAPPERKKLNSKLENWHELTFAAFRNEVKKAFHAEIPLKQRGEWEVYLAETAAEVHRLSEKIAAAEHEIDQIVYRLFDLTPDEIALLEASLAGQY
jgi:hypothetical protein